MSPHDLQWGCFIPMVCFVIHRSMVALKYATMSDCEYNKYLTASWSDSVTNTNY